MILALYFPWPPIKPISAIDLPCPIKLSWIANVATVARGGESDGFKSWRERGLGFMFDWCRGGGLRNWHNRSLNSYECIASEVHCGYKLYGVGRNSPCILDGSHDETHGDTPRAKDATDAAIDVAPNPGSNQCHCCLLCNGYIETRRRKGRGTSIANGPKNPPYKFKWIEKTIPVAEGSSETTAEGYMENYKNFIVDACPNACEMWKAIERLKQGESINVQDLETNLYWEFGKFTSRDGESLESYYLRVGNKKSIGHFQVVIVLARSLLYD
ncbi:hypothetical protein Tco_0825003 [Tanacetum coccineum]